MADKVLSAEAPVREIELVLREEPYGRFWGSSGFLSGPGFAAYGKDFPPGTVFRLRAEVILPEPEAGS